MIGKNLDMVGRTDGTNDSAWTLATRDRRAAETYRALDIDFELID